MALRDFRPIRPVDFRGAALINSSAGRFFDQGADALKSTLTGLGKRREAEVNNDITNNNQIVTAGFDNIKSLADFNAAEANGEFTAEAFSKRFGNRLSSEHVTKEMLRTRNRLQMDAKNEAYAVGRQMAMDTGDITAGTNAMVETLTKLGAKPTVAESMTNDFLANTDALQKSLTKRKTDQFDTTITRANDMVSKGAAWGDVQRFISDNAPADMLSEALTKGRDNYDNRTKMTPDQVIEMNQLSKSAALAVDETTQKKNQALGALNAELDAVPDPISAETASALDGVTNFEEHVLGRFKNEFDSTLGISTLGSIGKGTEAGNKAYRQVASKYRSMLKDGNLPEKDIAAILWQAYMNTNDKHESFLGANGIHMDTWEKEIDRIVRAHDSRKEIKGRMGTTSLKYDTAISSLKRDDLEQQGRYSRDALRNNRTGTPMDYHEPLAGVSFTPEEKKVADNYFKNTFKKLAEGKTTDKDLVPKGTTKKLLKAMGISVDEIKSDFKSISKNASLLKRMLVTGDNDLDAYREWKKGS